MSAKKTDQNQSNSSDAPANAMPLFYKNPMPLDSKAHANLALKKNFGLGFTREVNAVPINLIEMQQICHFYPIAFSPDDFATPVAILGLRDKENLFLKQDGSWEEAYIPAYIRRYPFIFSEVPDSDQLTLCFDNVPEIVSKDGEQKFFDQDGKPSKLANDALEFCKSYHAAAQQTLLFSQALLEHDLLVERQVQINISSSQRINFSGFKIVDEQKLMELEPKKLAELRDKGWLAAIYAHLLSGTQWQMRLAPLLSQRVSAEAA